MTDDERLAESRGLAHKALMFSARMAHRKDARDLFAALSKNTTMLADRLEKLRAAAWDVCADQTPAALWDATEALRAVLEGREAEGESDD